MVPIWSRIETLSDDRVVISFGREANTPDHSIECTQEQAEHIQKALSCKPPGCSDKVVALLTTIPAQDASHDLIMSVLVQIYSYYRTTRESHLRCPRSRRDRSS